MVRENVELIDGRLFSIEARWESAAKHRQWYAQTTEYELQPATRWLGSPSDPPVWVWRDGSPKYERSGLASPQDALNDARSWLKSLEPQRK
jgi:hypothetical protein